MPKSRKPVPKSQKEISRSQQEPYVNPENGDTRGNPNEPVNFEQFTKKEQNGLDHNRSKELSSKNDTTKPFTVGLQDIDESIMYYFQNLLKKMDTIKIKEVR